MITTSVSLDCNPVWFEGRDLVNYGISRLDGREGDIFSRYFFEGYTMEEIGVVHRTSKSNVCRIVHKIKCKFRKRVC